MSVVKRPSGAAVVGDPNQHWVSFARLKLGSVSGELKDSVLAEFAALQNQLTGCLDRAEGLDLGRLRIVSPFDARIKYNLYSCFRLIPAHQRQHLRQAEQGVLKLQTAQTGARV